MEAELSAEDAALVTDLYPGARRFAAAVAPWDMDPDDVLHAALVSVLRKGHLHVADNPLAYLRRSIVNEVASEIRRNRKRRSVLGRLRPSVDHTVDPSFPSDLAELMRLRPIERAVLYLHDIEGLPFDEVAAAVEITSSNARMIASRARRQLRLLLIEEGSL